MTTGATWRPPAEIDTTLFKEVPLTGVKGRRAGRSFMISDDAFVGASNMLEALSKAGRPSCCMAHEDIAWSLFEHGKNIKINKHAQAQGWAAASFEVPTVPGWCGKSVSTATEANIFGGLPPQRSRRRSAVEFSPTRRTAAGKALLFVGTTRPCRRHYWG